MAVNEFEKNAKGTMDEFTIHPSEEVWQKVELAIAEKKRKRRVIFFILFSCMGVLLAGYGINNFLTGSNTIIPKNQKAGEKSQTNINSVEQSKNKQEAVTRKIKEDKNGRLEITLSKKPVHDKRLDDHHRINEIKKSFVQHKNPMQVENNNSNDLAASKVKNENQNKKTAVTETRPLVQNPFSKNNQADSIASNNQREVSANTPENITTNKADTVSKAGDQDKVDKAIAEIKKTTSPGKSFFAVKWGLNLSGGLSKITQNSFLHSFIGAADKSLNSSPNSNGNTGAVNGGGGTGSVAVTNPQSASHSSFAFKIGLAASKNFSKRSSLSIGIQYAYLSDEIKTGYRQTNNSQLNALFNIPAYYSGATQQTFTDRFHFIELPVIYDWRITGNTTHFLSIEAGASFSYLISSNALVYDTAALGIYYHTKDQFNRASINLISGLSYHARKKSFELIVGPRFTFNMNDIFKSDIDQRKYFLYSGVEASILFEKNKKN